MGEEVTALEMEAVVYSLLSRTGEDVGLWIRRRGEAPVLIENRTGEHTERLCVNPDGTGYVVWVSNAEMTHRTQTIAVGEDWVSAQGERPFPLGYNAVGCPLAWSPSAFIVNLTSELTYSIGAPPSDTRPYRVSVLDGGFTVEAIEGAEAPWKREGPFILERRPDSEESNRDAEVVLWHGGVEPSPQMTWSADRYISVQREGPWWSIRRFGDTALEGSSISVVPTADPERDPLVLLETKDPEVLGLGASFSPSGEYVAVTRGFVEDRAEVEVVRLVGNAISQRRTIVVAPEELGRSGYSVADTGHTLFNTPEAWRLYVAPFDGPPRILAPTDPEPARVWGHWVEDINAVLVDTRAIGGTARVFALHSLADGGVTPVLTSDGCDIESVRGHEAVFACPDESFEWADLSAAVPRTNTLEGLTPTGAQRATAAFPFEWAGVPWYDLVFTIEGGMGYIRVMYQADTKASLALGEAGTHLSRWAFLPALSK